MSSVPGTVVVGYDGSPDAKRALAWAVELARATGAPLRVVVGLGDPRFHRVTDLDVEWDDAWRAGLSDDARSVVDALGFPGAALELSEQAPTPALLATADSHSVLVLGSRGHSRLSGALVGSVSQHVAQHAPCTVVVVREPSNPDERAVLVGVDASSGCHAALDFGFDHAARTGARVRAMYVSEHAHRPGGKHVQAPPDESLAAAEPLIDEAIKPHAAQHPEVSVERVLVPGSPWRTLADASEHAALVVVGSHGRGAFESLLLGSVGQALLRHAPCTVVIAR